MGTGARRLRGTTRWGARIPKRWWAPRATSGHSSVGPREDRARRTPELRVGVRAGINPKRGGLRQGWRPVGPEWIPPWIRDFVSASGAGGWVTCQIGRRCWMRRGRSLTGTLPCRRMWPPAAGGGMLPSIDATRPGMTWSPNRDGMIDAVMTGITGKRRPPARRRFTGTPKTTTGVWQTGKRRPQRGLGRWRPYMAPHQTWAQGGGKLLPPKLRTLISTRCTTRNPRKAEGEVTGKTGGGEAWGYGHARHNPT